ncbi:MAG: hypothetical protein ACYDH5_09730 [Acidimicrobiales bacterium]
MDTLGIIRQIEGDPALRAQLRAVLLGDEFLELPRLVAELMEGFKRLQDALDRTQATLREFMASTDARLGRLESDGSVLKSDVSVLKSDVSVLKSDVSVLKGSDLERRVAENPGRYLPEQVERARVLRGEALDDLLDEIARKAPLGPAEARRLRSTDIVVAGRHPGSNQRVTVVVEASWTVHLDDIVRAAESAEILRRRSQRSVAVAAGHDLGGSDAAREATARGVALVQIA